MALLADHLVGRAEELGSLDQVLDRARSGPRGRGRAGRRAGDRQDASARRARRPRGRQRAARPLGLGVGARARSAVLGLRGCARRVRARARPESRLQPRRGRANGARARLPLAAALATEHDVALQHERYRSPPRGARAARAPRGGASRSSSCSTTSTGPTPASVELLGALLRRPPAAAVLLALAVPPAPDAGASAGRARAGAPRGHADPRRARRAQRGRGATSYSATRSTSPTQPPSTRRAAATRSICEQLARSLDRAAARRLSTTRHLARRRIGVPSDRRGFAQRGARAAVGRRHAASSKERQWRAIPSSPSSAAAAAAMPEAAAMDAIDELLRLDLVRTTDVPRRFRFRHPLVRRAVYEATRRRLAARRPRALRRSARGAGRDGGGARPPRRALGARGRRSAPSPSCARRARRPPGWRRRAPRAGSRTRCACCRRTRRRRSASSSSLARSGALTATGHFAESHDALLEALAIVPDEPHALRARVARACAARRGPPRTARAGRQPVSQRALADLPDQGSPEAVALMIELAMNLVWRAKYEAMHEWAERAVERGESGSATRR